MSTRFVDSVLAKLAEGGDWAHANWVKFVFMLIVCNGAGQSQGVTSQALDFEDTVQARFLRLLTGEAQGRAIVDFEMLNLLSSSLVSQIHANFAGQSDQQHESTANFNSPLPRGLNDSPSTALTPQTLCSKLQAGQQRLVALADLLYLRALSVRQTVDYQPVVRCLDRIELFIASVPHELANNNSCLTAQRELQSAAESVVFALLNSFDQPSDLVKYLEQHTSIQRE